MTAEISIGSQFGELTVVAFKGIDVQRKQCWLCVCRACRRFTGPATIENLEAQHIPLKPVRAEHLRSGRVKSCGCVQNGWIKSDKSGNRRECGANVSEPPHPESIVNPEVILASWNAEKCQLRGEEHQASHLRKCIHGYVYQTDEDLARRDGLSSNCQFCRDKLELTPNTRSTDLDKWEKRLAKEDQSIHRGLAPSGGKNLVYVGDRSEVIAAHIKANVGDCGRKTPGGSGHRPNRFRTTVHGKKRSFVDYKTGTDPIASLNDDDNSERRQEDVIREIEPRVERSS